MRILLNYFHVIREVKSIQELLKIPNKSKIPTNFRVGEDLGGWVWALYLNR